MICCHPSCPGFAFASAGERLRTRAFTVCSWFFRLFRAALMTFALSPARLDRRQIPAAIVYEFRASLTEIPTSLLFQGLGTSRSERVTMRCFKRDNIRLRADCSPGSRSATRRKPGASAAVSQCDCQARGFPALSMPANEPPVATTLHFSAQTRAPLRLVPCKNAHDVHGCHY